MASNNSVSQVDRKAVPASKRNREELKHIKYRKKCKTIPVPGTIDIQVVGAGGMGTPQAVMVNLNNFR